MNLCTHLIYAFASYDDISSETAKSWGAVSVTDFTSLKRRNLSVKFMISVGGATANNGEISNVGLILKL